jgi:hypothetical protein
MIKQLLGEEVIQYFGFVIKYCIYIRVMNSKNKYIIALFILMILIIVYFSIFAVKVSVFAVKEDFTPTIRGMYNPKKREVRLYADKLKKQATEYVDVLHKTFSWA